ncbi:hypothetical protein NEF87_004754 [Candidatus Lokiarchaeum ossiferum]|uniref:Uncharacterized protein n=1 Tax=Candidatus Lokiarchaeum ossiferum TaxID=2951803 RepID=A0ABY6I0X0_9ARCH|nr:hypothetical protein NEF87_004754 [Candidatus Lokiarchaeum sp. B-35]
MAEEKKKNILTQLNGEILNFSEKVFGKQGREFLESTQKQIHDFNIGAIRSFVNFTDQLIADTKLQENELVKKSSNTVKDLLRQFGVIEEDSEDDF